MPILNIDDILVDASLGGYNGAFSLSNTTALTLLSVLSVLYDYRRYWYNDDGTLDEGDEEIIEELLSLANSELMTPAEAVIMEIGSTVLWWSTTTPDKYLICDGTQYLKADYPELSVTLGSEFSIDANNFVVPNLVDRVPVGDGSRNINDSGGEDEHTLIKDELPDHSHFRNTGLTDEFSISNAVDPTRTSIANTQWDVGTGKTYYDDLGGGIVPIAPNTPFSVMQKYRVARWIIYAGN